MGGLRGVSVANGQRSGQKGYHQEDGQENVFHPFHRNKPNIEKQGLKGSSFLYQLPCSSLGVFLVLAAGFFRWQFLVVIIDRKI
jgi:hypothetical protein